MNNSTLSKITPNVVFIVEVRTSLAFFYYQVAKSFHGQTIVDVIPGSIAVRPRGSKDISKSKNQTDAVPVDLSDKNVRFIYKSTKDWDDYHKLGLV